MDKLPLKSGKMALFCDPYRPDPSMMTPLEGRDRELKMIFASWIATGIQPPLCPLLVGEPGVGKNRIVYELAKLAGLDLYIMQGHEDITAEDLACSVRFGDGESHRMDYVLSPLVTAMHRGAICFIDEIGKIRPRALALLVSVLDERRYIDSTLLGERVQADSAFRFVAATNTGEVNDLPEFIQSRMRPVINVNRPSKDDINKIIASRVNKNVQTNMDKLLLEFWKLWASKDKPPTPRDAIHMLALASTLSEYEQKGGDAVLKSNPTDAGNILRGGQEAPQIGPDHLQVAFKELFSTGEKP